MKKIIILVVTLIIVLLHFDTKAYTAKRIDLRTKEDETSIVFLKQKDNISLLVDREKSSKLFLIKLENKEELKDSLDIFNVNPNISFLKDSLGYNDDIYISKDDYITMKIGDYNLCIVKNKAEVMNCDFVYLLELDKEFEVDEKILTVFYDENINDEYLGLINESWIDSHIVSTEGFTILKLNSEGYNILIVPLAKR